MSAEGQDGLDPLDILEMLAGAMEVRAQAHRDRVAEYAITPEAVVFWAGAIREAVRELRGVEAGDAN